METDLIRRAFAAATASIGRLASSTAREYGPFSHKVTSCIIFKMLNLLRAASVRSARVVQQQQQYQLRLHPLLSLHADAHFHSQSGSLSRSFWWKRGEKGEGGEGDGASKPGGKGDGGGGEGQVCCVVLRCHEYWGGARSCADRREGPTLRCGATLVTNFGHLPPPVLIFRVGFRRAYAEWLLWRWQQRRR